MIAGVPLAPDGIEALAALVARYGWPAPGLVGEALARAVAPSVGRAETAVARLARVVARRTALPAAHPSPAGRSAAARFARRQARRWCIAQAVPDPLPPRAELVRLGARARAAGWAGDLDDEAAGLRVLVWATDDAGRRRDLVALADRAVAHRVGHATPLAPAQARALT